MASSFATRSPKGGEGEDGLCSNLISAPLAAQYLQPLESRGPPMGNHTKMQEAMFWRY